MIAYWIRILPLIKNLKRVTTDFTQPWYADGAGALGMFARLEIYFDSLTRQVMGHGYHPNPIKSILFLRPDNIKAKKCVRGTSRI